MALLTKANNTQAFNTAGSWVGPPASGPTNLDTAQITNTLTASTTTVNNTASSTVGSIQILSSFPGVFFRIGSTTTTIPVALDNSPDTANGALNYSVYVAAGKELSTINGWTINASAIPHKFWIGPGGSFSYNSYGTTPNSTFQGSGRIALYGGGDLYQGFSGSPGVYAGGYDLYNGNLRIRGDTGTLPLGVATNTVVFQAEPGGTVKLLAGLFQSARTVPNLFTLLSDATISAGDAAATNFVLYHTGNLSGTGNLTISNYNVSSSVHSTVTHQPGTASTGYTGNINLTGGAFWVGWPLANLNVLPNVPRYDVVGSFSYLVFAGGPYDVNSDIFVPTTGFLTVVNNLSGSGTGPFFKTSLTNIAYNTAPATSSTEGPTGGLYVYATTSQSPVLTVSDFPARVSLMSNGTVANSNTHIKYQGVGGVTYTTNFDLFVTSNHTASCVFSVYANQTDGLPITLAGNFTRYGRTSATVWSYLNLRGTSAADNVLSGNISSSGGNRNQILSVVKVDAGKWILTGNNSHAGDTYSMEGVLGVGNPDALRESVLDWRHTDSGSLTFEGGYTNYNVGAIRTSTTGTTRSLEIPTGITLTAGGASWTTAGATVLPMSATGDFQFYCRLIGGGNFKKVGPSCFHILNGDNTLTGTVTSDGGAMVSYPDLTSSTRPAKVMFPTVSLITLNNNANMDDTIISSIPVTVGFDIVLNGTSNYTTSNYSASGGGEVSLTYTGNISGTGWLSLACFNQGLGGNRICSLKTTTLPANFSYAGNGGSASLRTGIYRWIGSAPYTCPTNISISVGNGINISDNSFIFSNDSSPASTIEVQGTIDKPVNNTTAPVSSLLGTADANLDVRGSGDVVFSGTITDTSKDYNFTSTTSPVVKGKGKLGLLVNFSSAAQTLTVSGDNSVGFRGDTQVKVGTLRLLNRYSLARSFLDWTSDAAHTGTLDLTTGVGQGITTYTIGALKSTVEGARVLSIPAATTLEVGNSWFAAGFSDNGGLGPNYGSVLEGDTTTVFRKVGSSSQNFTRASPNFLGSIELTGGTLVLGKSPASLTEPITSLVFPNASSMSVTGAAGTAATIYLRGSALINYPVTVAAGTFLSASSWSSVATDILDMTAYGVTGQGTLTIDASGLITAASTRYARLKTSALPSKVYMTVVPSTNINRYSQLQYSGGTATVSSVFTLVNWATTGAWGWTIQNVSPSAGTLTLSGNISKTYLTPGGAATTAGTLTFGGDVSDQDIILTGSLQQGVAVAANFYYPGSPAVAADTGQFSIVKAGSKRLTIAGTLNNYLGGFTHSAGITTLRHGSALGASTGTLATTFTAGTVEFDGNGTDQTYTKGSSAFAFNGALIKNVANNNTVVMANTSTMGASTTFDVAANTKFTLTGNLGGLVAYNLTKTSPGTLTLNATSSGYLGTTDVQQGTLEVKKLSLVGAASSIGAPTLAGGKSPILMGGLGDATLLHTGTTADSTDRNISFTGPNNTTLTIDSSGVGGSVNFTNGGTLTFTVLDADHTVVLQGSNAATNTWSRVIPNGAGTGKTAFVKQGTNKWVVTVAPTYTGLTTVTQGTLSYNNQTRTILGGLVMNGGTLTNDGQNIVTFTSTMQWSSGTVTANIAGANLTVTADTDKTILNPVLGKNAGLTGTANLNNGCLVKLVTETVTPTANGQVMGSLNVTVNNGGHLATMTGTLQRGRARYDGDITFNAGSTLTVGGTVL